tara:strand:+ start:374 stop:562 length:189 start_codon:yes stop_codon:yes gene_type:complete
MTFRIKKYYQFGRLTYNVEGFHDKSWFSICQTLDSNKKLATKLKESCESFVEEGGKLWFMGK